MSLIHIKNRLIHVHVYAYLQCMCAFIFIALLPLQMAYAQTPVQASSATGTLERIRSNGKLVLGYRIDNQPMSYHDASGKPAGYAATLCEKIAGDLKIQLALPTLNVEWVVVTTETALTNIAQGKIDLLCTGEATTLAKRKQVSFSEPIFLGGIAALLPTNAPAELQHILENRPAPYKPTWRGTVPSVVQHRTASAVTGTSAVAWLAERASTFKLIITILTEENYAAGVANVAKGKSDMLFGERAQLLAAAIKNPDTRKLKVLSRHFTYEPQALTLPRNDDDFRLAVDQALKKFIATPKFGELYTATFGVADSDTVEFFRGISLN